MYLAIHDAFERMMKEKDVGNYFVPGKAVCWYFVFVIQNAIDSI